LAARGPLAFALLALALLGCEAGPAPSTEPPPSPAFEYASAERIVAIGDLHGDVSAARGVLRLAGVIDAADAWTGGRTVVVQTGDQLDRGDDDREVLELLDRLAGAAAKSGGALVVLNGNHEVMNVQSDFRYVSPHGLAEYEEFNPGWLHAWSTPSEQRGRTFAFRPGGAVARQLARRPVVARVGDTLFVHGGVLPQHVSYGLARINREASAWMWGAQKEIPEILTSKDAPIWTRLYSDGDPDAAACGTLAQALEGAAAKRMVVGHTIQESGINSACDGRVWRIDVGLSKVYAEASETRPKPQVLEIQGQEARVLVYR